MSANITMESLKEFLKPFRLASGAKGECFTHGTMSLPNFNSGKYNIPKEELDNFYTNYSNAVSTGLPLAVNERPGPYGPLRVDFDLKSPESVGLKRQYTESILKKIVGYYQAEIKAIVHPSQFNDEVLTCIVLEKRAPRMAESKVVDGFHLHFPNFICIGQIQDKYLRDKVNIKMVENDIWLGAKFLEKIENLIDRDMSTKTWMMYGSMNYKNTKSTPYMYNRKQINPATKKFEEKCPWSKVPQDEQWGHVYNHELKEVPILPVFKNDMEGRTKSIKYYLPRFLSIRGYTKPTKLIDSIDQKLAMVGVSRKPRVRKIAKKRNIEDVLADIKLIKDANFMNCLSIERAESYDSWMDVGWTLFCIGEGHEECLKLWIDFSMKDSVGFKNGSCEELWDKMELRDKTIGSLRAMARHDDPEQYNEWVTTDINNFIKKSTLEALPAELDVANVAYAKYKGRFCCADASKNIWYEFRDHRWFQMKDALALKALIIEDLISVYLNYKSVNIGENQTRYQGNDVMLARLLIEDKRVIAIITKLKSIHFVENIIKFLKIKMHDPLFHTKMNENKNVLCCENGVIDLELCIFRDGRPDDYCTFSTGIHYQEYNEGDDEVVEYDLFIRKVYPNTNRKNYFDAMITACLQGGNVNKRFIICTGEANGGKSMTFKLMGLTYGDYMGKFPRQLLLRGNGVSSGQARPELALVRGKRIMSTQEITHMDNLDIGTLKELTGNDSFFTRGMYDSGGDINPQFTLWTQCNSPPNIPGNDEATLSRTRILECESKFVISSDLDKYPVPEDEEQQFEEKRFHADTKLADELPFLAPVMLWRAFQRFPMYKEKGLFEPTEVKTATETYKNKIDLYACFIETRVQREPNAELAKNTFMKLAEVIAEFQEWYKENYPSYFMKDKLGKMHIKNELSRRLGTIPEGSAELYGFGKQSRWWGYKLIQEDDLVDTTTRKQITQG